MKKIAVFTGAGISAESGISTYRDIKDGLWYNYKVEEVATTQGWRTDKAKVLEFHNMLRKKLHDKKPNLAHELIASLEDDFDVTIITQNVDELHEKAGSSTVHHIHGELMKCKSSLDPSLVYDARGDINIGDKCLKGSQLRPYTVLFGEFPHFMEESIEAIRECDILIIVGTGFDIVYTANMITAAQNKIYYVDPKPNRDIEYEPGLKGRVDYIEKTATIGVKEVFDNIYENFQG
tara:strand:+ start:196545 stop:197249 length:705 start_codon:yes stop_codon:yes gene_type:complete